MTDVMKGYPTLPIDRKKLIDAMTPCFGKVKYKLGAKAALGSRPASFSHIDCSGFVRWLLDAATGGKVKDGTFKIPDGSANQRAWFEAQGFKHSTYDENGAALSDDRLRIAFIAPRKGGKVGHVWLIISGRTIESYGGVGPGRRKWNSGRLKDQVVATYVLTDKLPNVA